MRPTPLWKTTVRSYVVRSAPTCSGQQIGGTAVRSVPPALFAAMKPPRWLAALGLLLATAMPAVAQCPLSIATAINYAAGNRPVAAAVGDFNADGRPDLAVANQNSNNVSILLGNANGTFQAAVNYAAGSTPSSVAVGDFNADGQPDLAVANNSSNNVSILLGNANGTFQGAVNYAVGFNPWSVAVGDFNADGRLDLAVANAGAFCVSILLGNANGTFEAAVNHAVGSEPVSVAVGDFNADGRPDLAVANSFNGVGGNNVSILLGNANGTFQAAVFWAVGTNPRSVAVGDFNADGRPDLAVTNSFNGVGGNNVSILLGNANGTFQAAVNYAVGSGPRSVAVGDFNADGQPDLAVANVTNNNVSVLLNTSAFPPPVIIQQPVGLVVPAGQNAALTVAANGFGNTLTYQWRKNGEPIANGGAIAGATTPTLTFTPALVSDTASYDVLVTGAAACTVGAQVTTSATGFLDVTGTNPCPIDFNGDGFLNQEDLSGFLTAFLDESIPPGPGGFAATPCPGEPAPYDTLGYQADFNRDCSFNQEDLSAFITEYFTQVENPTTCIPG